MLLCCCFIVALLLKREPIRVVLLCFIVVVVEQKAEVPHGAFVPWASTCATAMCCVHAERSETSYEAPLCECQTVLRKNCYVHVFK